LPYGALKSDEQSFTIEGSISTTITSEVQVVMGKGIAATLEGTSSITDGRWHHLAAVRDKSVQQSKASAPLCRWYGGIHGESPLFSGSLAMQNNL
jgi:hypothetical protein